jgi:hypothetical protein
MLPELSPKVWKAVEEGRFSLKSRGLNRFRLKKRIFQAYPAASFLPFLCNVLGKANPVTI